MTTQDTKTDDTSRQPRQPSAFEASAIIDPYPLFQMIREQGSGVMREPMTNSYMVTRHDDVDALLRDHSLSRDPRKADPETMPGRRRAEIEPEEEQRLSILFLDPPDHTRLRGLVTRAFTPRAVEAMRPRAQQIAGELLDAVAGQPHFDLMAALAAPFPTIVIAEMLGVDASQQAQFKEWSDAFVRTLDPFIGEDEIAAAERARTALDTYLREVIAERRAAPRSDLISGLIAAQEENDRLTDLEMITQIELLLTAGNVTTTDLIGNGVYALLTNPSELKKLQDDPSLIARAVEEMLRFDSPVILTGRTPLTDIEVGGCPMAARQNVTPVLGAANHDPRAYPNPDAFDITRADTHHHSFGGGLHFCLGAPLARLEAQVAIATLVRRFPTLRLAQDAQPQRRLMPGFRGFLTLDVAVD